MKRFRVMLNRIGEESWCFSTGVGCDGFPIEFRAFDFDEYYRGLKHATSMIFVNDDLQALVACDWLIEQGWELDTGMCCEHFRQLHPALSEVLV